MPDEEQPSHEQVADERTRQQAAQQGLTANQRHVDEQKFSASFLDRIQDPDVDSEIHDWLSAEFPALFSGAHIVGQREAYYEEQQDYLNRAKAQKFVAGNNPGRLLQRHPSVKMTMDGETPDSHNESHAHALNSDEKSKVRNAMEVATTRQSLAVNARGLRSVTTATSETRTVRQEEDGDGGGLLSSATGVLD
jgi:hypothetical protein